jgi:hypothetical protein
MKLILPGVNSDISALMFCQEKSNQTAIPGAQNTAATPPFFGFKLQSTPINGNNFSCGYAQRAKVCRFDVELGAKHRDGCFYIIKQRETCEGYGPVAASALQRHT